jgi:2-(1,2-epoxy-1,2-dihydrophenyl)acetyl-CoA isomerase
MSDCLLEKRDDGIALLTLNRPDRMNALSEAMGDLFAGHLADCELDPKVRCIVITGAGRGFCAGGDVGGMKERTAAGEANERGMLASVDERIRLLRARQDRSVMRLHTMAKPTVAIINGAAIGAGLSFAIACDIRLMGDGAKLSAGFGKMGLSGDMGGTYFLSKLVNTSIARELCFTTEMIDAQRALQLGLVNRVYPQAKLMEEGMAYCAKLAAGPTSAFGRMKENLNFASTGSIKETLDFEARNMVLGSLSGDHKEAVAAFMEKRPPKFTGA